MILVSVAHYIGVLQEHDFVLIASAIGLLVDLGHYRLIKSALKHGGVGWWAVAVVMTLIAFGYHFAFYSISGADVVKSFLLSIPIPFLIIALAALSVRERWARKFGVSDPLANVRNEPQRTNSEPRAKAKRGETKQRIITAHRANPLMGPSELANLIGASKAFVSEVLTAERALGFKGSADHGVIE
jgi:hypothetical protein